MIYEGFRCALGGELTPDTAGVLVDEEFGAGILRDANRSGYVTALSTERSGSAEFEFEYVKKRTTRTEAATRIALRYRRGARAFSGARHSHSSTA